MAVASIQAPPPIPAPAVEITTPRWLTGSVVLVWLLALVFVTASIVAVREHRDALHVIANQSARSVIAAEQMAAGLADMDANAANGLLTKQASEAAYDASRKLMSDALVDAAHNMSFSGEEEQIKALAKDSGIYSARVEAAFTLQSSNMTAAVAQYLKAAQLMDVSLMPGARNVDAINRKELDEGYKSIQRVSLIQTALVWITGLAMLAVLLRVQFFLSERMRRTLNPLCLLATLMIGGLLFYTTFALSTSTHQIEVVKSDAFESLHLLWQAKAVAYEANAQESRFLLDRQGAAKHQARFVELANQIAEGGTKLLDAVKTSRTAKPSTAIKGLLADELRNVTFYGERESGVDAVVWWAKYRDIEAKIWGMEVAGQHDKAQEIAHGSEPGQSNWAFNGFISAIDSTLAINQKAFDEASNRGFAILQHFEATASVIGLMAALACLFGVLPRIREYTA